MPALSVRQTYRKPRRVSTLGLILPTVMLTVLIGNPSAQADTSRLDDILKSGSLRVCTTGDYAPFTLQTSAEHFEGMDIDLAHSLANALNVELKLVKTSWPHLMDDFLSQCDIAMGGVSVTSERLKKAAFSQAHMVDGKTPIARCTDQAKYQSLQDIDKPEVRVIVNPGGTNEKFARTRLHQAYIEVHPDNVTIFDQIVAGKADVMITDASETLWQARKHHELCAIHPEQPFQFAEKAYMLPRGDVTFKAWVDHWMHDLQATGSYQQVHDKWLKP